ncbi:MAG: chorismate synthase [Clostridia bacterium]|nr:chorismate synthase [Clostridia bacterium]
MKYNDKQFSVYNGKNLTVEIFGASHAEEIGVKVLGFDGEKFNAEKLQEFCDRRRAKNSAYSTKRLETDKIIFQDGFDGEKVSGTLKAVIKNSEQRSSDYEKTVKIPRPSHADFVAWSKYGDGFDYRGGGKFSGRLTAPMCIAGGIAKQLLEEKGIKINAYISAIGKVNGKTYTDYDVENFDFKYQDINFPLIDEGVKESMLEVIESARVDGDSVGGKIDCVVTGVPVGTGEYMFDSIESVISHLAFAVPAIKGIEFGSGFSISEMNGSKANDNLYYDGESIKTKTNHNGGINGGIANGMPITFRVAVKPTPSIAKEQDSVDMLNKQNVKLKIQGRHDACIVPRAVPVIEAITALAIYDILG